MDRNSFLVWWLLGVPILLAIVDRMMMGGTRHSTGTAASGFPARADGVGSAGNVS